MSIPPISAASALISLPPRKGETFGPRPSQGEGADSRTVARLRGRALASRAPGLLTEDPRRRDAFPRKTRDDASGAGAAHPTRPGDASGPGEARPSFPRPANDAFSRADSAGRLPAPPTVNGFLAQLFAQTDSEQAADESLPERETDAPRGQRTPPAPHPSSLKTGIGAYRAVQGAESPAFTARDGGIDVIVSAMMTDRFTSFDVVI